MPRYRRHFEKSDENDDKNKIRIRLIIDEK